MTMPTTVNCRYFYGDYHRGNHHEECRLLAGNPDNPIAWRRKLCDTCPIPEIVITSTTRDLALEATVARRMLRERVVITFAVCTKHMLELDDPKYCPACAAEAAG